MKALVVNLILLIIFIPMMAFGSLGETSPNLGLTSSTLGWVCIGIFIIAYCFVIAEEFIHLPKSKPVLFAAGLIWILVGYLSSIGQNQVLLRQVLEHNLIEYASLLLFLLVAMTYISAMTERNVFEALRSWLVSRGYSYRKLFWITGFIAFFLSPIADNLTTALLMGAVVLAVGKDNKYFVTIACVNIVVAANAGGAFSPFGDITTLMVWQSQHAGFFDFFTLFFPALVNYIIPASIMSFAVPLLQPKPIVEKESLKEGAIPICLLFLATIATAVSFEQILHLPPYLGMMFGLSYLFLFAYYLKMKHNDTLTDVSQFNIFSRVAQAEWDTLFFFFGVIFCVGGLGFIGYLEIMSSYFYDGWGATNANIAMGLISAVIDNIPVMFAILTMNPDMDLYQWLLITLTAGVGGSLLSIGSAAGVALMGQAKGVYTFFAHLKWSWAIALGYVASIGVHYLLNSPV
ncbi:MAG: NhaD family Na+/H+ antiporter [Candidatus Azotimanducaceae bacterium]|jgi:NhaD family Na+/H+ antiporter